MESLINKVKFILLNPKEIWNKYTYEYLSVQDTILTYVLPLSLIPAVALFLHKILETGNLLAAISIAVITVLSNIIGIWLSGYVIYKLAPSFNANSNMNDTVKLLAYSYTPVWVAGVLKLINGLEIFSLLATIYALYIYYKGLKPVTKVKKINEPTFFATSILVIILLNTLVDFILVI